MIHLNHHRPRTSVTRPQLPLTWLNDARQPLPDTSFALPEDSDAPGLLAAGGEVEPVRLREAYSKGVFPWYSEGQPVLWWSPDPRMVLPVAEFKVSRSLRKTLSRFRLDARCEIRIDHDFRTVMSHCAAASRRGQSGTWIVPEMVDAYSRWHDRERAVHSIETWIDGELTGGLYAVNIGQMLYGESMFSLRTDSSKIALAALVCFCRANAITLVDCQQRTTHLASLGAREWPRAAFERHLANTVWRRPPGDWTYHPAMWAQLRELGDESAVASRPSVQNAPPEIGS
ncbi:leucyl/phenylalanyl-tRNA--protein transferase [soil metagenome]